VAESKTNTHTQDIEQDPTDVIGGDVELRSSLTKEYKTAQDAIRYFSLDWDEFENLFFVQGRTADNTRQRLSDGTLSQIVTERAGRVMAQMPTGTVHALGLQNQGKGLLMDLVLEKYIMPNADEQYDLETKLFLWDAYSNTYGTMAMCYDWTDEENYTGPTCWLVPMRNFFPQQGRLSVRNCDFVFISTFQPRNWLHSLVDEDVEDYDLDAIQEILDESKNGKTLPAARLDYLRVNPMFEYRRRAPFTDTGDIEVVTKYESGKNGRWIDFCPDFGNRVIRNIPNPHKNGKIPVVLKYAMPTLDSIMGLGDMERGRYIQYAIDTVDNLMIDGIKLRTYPPIKVVNGNVVMPTLRFQPGAKWLVSNPNDVSHHQFPDVDNNNNALLSALKGAMNNVTGTSQTTSSAESSSAATGKTPTAINKAGQSESTRDAIDAKLMSKAVQELFGNMINLINDVEHSNPIELYCFGDEIAQIAADYPDIKDAVKVSKDGKTVKVTIKPSRIKNEKGYQYKVDPMSSMEQDDAKAHQQLTEVLQSTIENPEALQVLQTVMAQSGKTIDVAELWTEWIKTGGLRDWKKIVKPLAQATPPGQEGPPQQMQGQQQGPQQSTPAESIKISDLPPAGQVQMAAQAGIQLTPQDFEQQQAQEADLKTKSQIAVKKAGAPAPAVTTVQHIAPHITDPDIAQAHAQIMAHHEALRSNLQQEVTSGGQR
jgi:hypothetical protein